MVQVNFTLLAGNFGTTISQYLFSSPLDAGHPGDLKLIKSFASGMNPSWIGLNRNNNSVLCATQEIEEGGALTFIMDRSQGDQDLTLSLISNDTVDGNGPPFCDFSTDDTLVYYPVFGGKKLTVFSTPDGATLDDRQIASFESEVNATSATSKPHQAVDVVDEVLVPDLGLDKIWRLTRGQDGLEIAGSINHRQGSGPRHLVVKDNCLVTIHETDSTITSQFIPPINETTSPFLSLFSTPPKGSNLSEFASAEVRLLEANVNFDQDVIFASNRQIGGNFAVNGDTIVSYAFDSKNCTLRELAQNPTGLINLRTMEPDLTGRFIVTAAFVQGGVKVFERSGEHGAQLTEVASNNEAANATSFAWLSAE